MLWLLIAKMFFKARANTFLQGRSKISDGGGEVNHPKQRFLWPVAILATEKAFAILMSCIPSLLESPSSMVKLPKEYCLATAVVQIKKYA